VATGIANAGGFLASLTTILPVGLGLDAVTEGGPATYSLDAFKSAFAVQYVLWVCLPASPGVAVGV